MPEYVSPGVHVEEIELGPHPIKGVSTSTAGFLGETLRGPQEPRLITGFEEFKRLYGGFIPTGTGIGNADLPFAIQGFFANGGQRCFVTRITAADALPVTADNGGMRISGIGPGTFGNRMAIKIEPGSLQDPDGPTQLFKLTVLYWDVLPNPLVDPTDAAQSSNPNRREPTLLEVYDNLTDNPASIDFYETRIGGSSSLIGAVRTTTGITTVRAFGLLGTNGTDGGTIVLSDYQGRTLPALPNGTVCKTGLLGFEEVDEIALVIATP